MTFQVGDRVLGIWDMSNGHFRPGMVTGAGAQTVTVRWDDILRDDMPEATSLEFMASLVYDTPENQANWAMKCLTI